MKSRKSFPLRLNPELYQAIEAWAQQEMRQRQWADRISAQRGG